MGLFAKIFKRMNASAKKSAVLPVRPDYEGFVYGFAECSIGQFLEELSKFTDGLHIVLEDYPSIENRTSTRIKYIFTSEDKLIAYSDYDWNNFNSSLRHYMSAT